MIDSESDSETSVQRGIELERDPLASDENDITIKDEPLTLYNEHNDNKTVNNSSASLDHLSAEDVQKLKRLQWDRQYRARNRDKINKRKRERRRIKKILRESAKDPLSFGIVMRHDDITVDPEYLEGDIDLLEEVKLSRMEQCLSKESLGEEIVACDNKIVEAGQRKNNEKECCDTNQDEINERRAEYIQVMTSIQQSNKKSLAAAEAREERKRMLHRMRQRRYLAKNRDAVLQRKKDNRILLLNFHQSASIQPFDTDETSSTSLDNNEEMPSKGTNDGTKISSKSTNDD